MSDTDDSPRPNDDHAAGDDHRRRIRTDFSDLIEDMIEYGRRRGLFDGLAGRGRPLAQ